LEDLGMNWEFVLALAVYTALVFVVGMAFGRPR